jgi:enoyl-[acyl-carrier-protein] reductase (NADH)
MNREQIIISPIGIIHTPHNNISNMPIKTMAAKGIRGLIELYSELGRVFAHGPVASFSQNIRY